MLCRWWKDDDLFYQVDAKVKEIVESDESDKEQYSTSTESESEYPESIYNEDVQSKSNTSHLSRISHF